MNVEDLQLITRSHTANVILKHFSQRERIGNDTTLDAFKSYLIKHKNEINTDDFYKFFSDLEESGVGELKEHAGNSRGKFLWYYSLRDISEQILNPNKKIEIKSIDQTEVINKKRPPGRPVGYRPKLKRVINEHKPQVPEKAYTQDYNNVIFLFTTDDGNSIALRIPEAERLIKQLDIVKAKLG